MFMSEYSSLYVSNVLGALSGQLPNASIPMHWLHGRTTHTRVSADLDAFFTVGVGLTGVLHNWWLKWILSEKLMFPWPC